MQIHETKDQENARRWTAELDITNGVNVKDTVGNWKQQTKKLCCSDSKNVRGKLYM